MASTTAADEENGSVKPKSFLNDPEDAVGEFIEGLLLQYPSQLRKLQNHNVVLSSSNLAEQSIHVLSGGGSGHEPAHAGYIGTGMLSGAILGGIFASPSVASILAAIRACKASTSTSASSKQSHEHAFKCQGILLIVKNYTGDRLNFGMACELANNEGGAPTRMVVVADDCAVPRTKGITGARGVAGTVWVHKVAGTMAASGTHTVDEIQRVAQSVANRIGSLGVALEKVTIPGSTTASFLQAGFMEMGMGIHGESGMRQAPMASSRAIASEMLEAIQSYGTLGEDGVTVKPLLKKGDHVALLVNNLGGTSNFELSILARDVVTQLQDTSSKYGVKVSRLYVGSYMTSFNMHGASLSILPLRIDDEITSYLDAPCTAPAWVSCDVVSTTTPTRPTVEEIPEVVVHDTTEGMAGVTLDSLPPVIGNFAAMATDAIRAAAQVLIDNEPLLTKYDDIVGDGDCGLTMKRGGVELLARLDAGALPMEHPSLLFTSVADAVSASMGGTSGILLELFFRKVSSATKLSSSLTDAFDQGVKAVSLYGGATVGSRTMLDAMVPAAAAASSSLRAAADAAKAGADGTATMESASAGRSNYVRGDVLMGTPDPGAIAVALVLDAMAKSLSS
eukprot:CAMPEP_0198295212 /NCGR_PEP_ID=MMETSP1449-20131203/26510_1 /TAXON_ID=420275 /ORGANISM="Attheya septentrionalis, Strain CCMP2084" /LENGTH=620 /DNA_ID=CAMNT_0043995443 /DNA_START=42 /DNA_END=1904 /DNA_ORIENTATION=+